MSAWHELIGEPTLADAILDRLVHNAYRIALDGPSMRKLAADQANSSAASTDAMTTAAKPSKEVKK